MIALLCALVAHGQDDSLTPSGEWRVIGSTLSEFPIDADGTTLGAGTWLDHRLRSGVTWKAPVFEAGVEVDLAAGTIAGETWTVAGTPDERLRDQYGAFSLDGVRARRAAVKTVVGNTQIEAGLVTSRWGLGMVANDGAVEPLFGRADFGDRVVRVRATRLPNHQGPAPRTTWLLTGAADLVIADDTARFLDGQRAIQGIVSLLGHGRRGGQIGTYFVARNQWEADPSRTTQAFVLDGYGDRWTDLSDGLRLRTALEVAGIAGRTSRATTYTARETVGVLQLGATGTATLATREDRLQAHLITGYASGDGNPDDGIARDFAFDRDLGAGMVLFDEVLAGIDAGTWVALNDPVNAGQPPDGAEALVTEGAIRRAVFAQPAVQVAPIRWIDARAGVLFAWGTALFAQPFETYRNGGAPANHLGVPVDSRLLGTELDGSLEVHRPAPEDDVQGPLWSVAVQGGLLFPAKALDGPSMPDTVHLATATARLRW